MKWVRIPVLREYKNSRDFYIMVKYKKSLETQLRNPLMPLEKCKTKLCLLERKHMLQLSFTN